MTGDSRRDPPFEGGSQPVTEHPPEVPTAGRSVLQWVVIAIAAMVVLAGLLYVVGLAGAA